MVKFLAATSVIVAVPLSLKKCIEISNATPISRSVCTMHNVCDRLCICSNATGYRSVFPDRTLRIDPRLTRFPTWCLQIRENHHRRLHWRLSSNAVVNATDLFDLTNGRLRHCKRSTFHGRCLGIIGDRYRDAHRDWRLFPSLFQTTQTKNWLNGGPVPQKGRIHKY